MIYVEQLSKRYDGRTVLEVPHWRVEPGEIVGLVGSNGAGKTTFLRLLLDLIEPDTGMVHIDGQPVTNPRWKSFTGSFLDQRFLIDYLSSGEFLDFIRAIYGLSRVEADKALEPFRAFLPMNGDAGKYLRDLSTGNAKKVGITAAMFFGPRLMVLDEPFANLDPPSQLKLKHLLKKAHEETGATMLISSHDLVHVTDLCSRITLIDRGRVVKDAPTSAQTLHELRDFFAGT
ncbi:MAG: ABC transporter ATP-binding protein [Rhodothermales bacterium]|nr:ABC transporter ATP-binding protein [Rhodothermales bacterium]MBO6780927.1 ABC transporter ATP-binding protein [Rhodothermales bacterium]